MNEAFMRGYYEAYNSEDPDRLGEFLADDVVLVSAQGEQHGKAAYLATYRGGMLVVSHDRQFLNRAVNRVCEIDEHSRQLKEYAGNYDAYVETKALERQRWEEEYERQQEDLRDLRKRVKDAASHAFSFEAIAIGIGPLAIFAALGYRGAPRNFIELLLRLWPLAGLVIYLLSNTSLSSAPLHAFNGITVPLSVLAVLGERLPHCKTFVTALFSSA